MSKTKTNPQEKAQENNAVAELKKVTVPTETIRFEVGENKVIEVVLRPFRFNDFAQAITIVNKYFAQYNQVVEKKKTLIQKVIDEYSDYAKYGMRCDNHAEVVNEGLQIEGTTEEKGKQEKSKPAPDILEAFDRFSPFQIQLEEIENNFDEGTEIAKSILALGGEDMSADIKTLVDISVVKTFECTNSQESVEKKEISPDFMNFTWAEMLILMGCVINLNLDFFVQNLDLMGINEILDLEKAQQQKQPTTGVK